MGSAVSSDGLNLPPKIDMELFKVLAPEHCSLALFNKLKGFDGFISLDRFIAFATKEATDVFVTHDWGIDELDRNNHERAKLLNKTVQSKNIKTWFDEEQMVGDVKEKMEEGIFFAAFVAVLVT